MYQPIDGPSFYGALSVGTSPVLLKVGASVYTERSVVSFQPTNGIIYYGFDASVTSSTGTKVYQDQIIWLEAAAANDIYLVAASGTINVRITEMG